MSRTAAERALKDGDLAAARRELQDAVRAEPAAADLRVFLFQLLAVEGEWERALNQLDVAGELDAANLAMVQMYRETLRCELLRAEVFAGRRSPLVFGQPEQWLALLIESLLVQNTERAAESAGLRERAFEAAPATAGTVDGTPFGWIADADMRLGPVCEAIVNGRYYWVPFERIARLDLEAPADLRDFVWAPAHLQFTNGGEVVGVVPTRYPGTESSADAALKLARKTAWDEVEPNVFRGLGQRVFATDNGEYPVLDIRSIRIEPADRGEGSGVDG
ncbi:MAG TPA: type VI secretion system accessory protein TagJ [Steroidobacteraceae bacterium]|nr:type VI secretion system accessory protein TagJ [Steroidobacteraceae bacterium]